MTTADSLTRRIAHIDGLRAIAVSLVVIFHAGLPVFASGFVGVDIFFVISGFLIIGQISDDLNAGKFSVVEFYARRAARILPPLFTVLSVTMVIACWIPLLPREIRRVGLSVIASAMFGANWYFWMLVDYFYPTAEREPLLHLWSLGVEEQFYVVTPLLLMGVYAFARRRENALLYTVAAALICSLAFAVVIAPTNPQLAFYSTPLRAWEFLLGGVLALALRRGIVLTEVQASVAGFVGVFAVLCGAILSVEPPERLYVEGLAALGGGLVILSGQFAPRAAVARLLSVKAMVGLGLISYSLYLWHWPLIAFIRLTQIDPPTVTQSLLAVVVLPLALSVATYYGVERPIRNLRKSGFRLRWRAVVAGAVASLFVAAFGGGLVMWSKALKESSRMEPYVAAETPLLVKCLGEVDGAALDQNCRMGSGSAPRVLLWGDSYALSFAGAVSAAADEAKSAAMLQWSSGCPPLLDTKLYMEKSVWSDCMDNNVTTANRLRSGELQSVSGVVLVAAWQIHHGHVAIEPAGEEVYRTLEAALVATLRDLDRLGLRVLLVGPPPMLDHIAPKCVFLYPSNADDRCGVNRQKAVAVNAAAVKALAAATSEFRNVRFIDLAPAFCDDGLCRAGAQGEVFYRDNHHLSVAGARVAQRVFRDDLAWLFAAHERKARSLTANPN